MLAIVAGIHNANIEDTACLSKTVWLKPSVEILKHLLYALYAGYDEESIKIEGLEEYWNYNIRVTATTSVASVESDQLENIKTLPTGTFI